MAKKYLNDYNEALTFFEAQSGDCSLGSVRKDLRAELGAWVVQFNTQDIIEHTGKKLIVTYNGKKATRATQNRYQAVVVAEDASGKLLILSAHYSAGEAHTARAKYNAGKFVNFNYRKAVTQPIVLEA